MPKAAKKKKERKSAIEHKEEDDEYHEVHEWFINGQATKTALGNCINHATAEERKKFFDAIKEGMLAGGKWMEYDEDVCSIAQLFKTKLDMRLYLALEKKRSKIKTALKSALSDDDK